MRIRLHIARMLAFVLLIIASTGQVHADDIQFPCQVRTTANVNLRTGPGTSYRVIKTVPKDTHVKALGMASGNRSWYRVETGANTGYISAKYAAVEKTSTATYAAQHNDAYKKRGSHGFNLGDTLWNIVRWLLKISAWLLLISVLFGLTDFGGIVLLFQIICAVGAIIGSFFFDSGRGGAVVAVMLMVLAGGYYLFLLLGGRAIGLISVGHGVYNLYRAVSMPFYIMNRLQRLLSKPWLPFTKKPHHTSDEAQARARKIDRIAQVPFYIACTPLRAINAVYFNIVIHLWFEYFNLVMEVIAPSSRNEGRRNVGQWIVKLPYRIWKYPLLHGFLTTVESIAFTLADCVIPTLTLYHGTSAFYSDAITADPNRNSWRQSMSNWHSGNFKTGGGNWGGDGIYFAPRRATSAAYSSDSGNIVVCRVSLGKVVNISQAPLSVYNNAGRYGKDHSAITRWALDREGYTTVEWWNQYGNYWEYCLLDWKNRYNHPWRIRPIYVVKVNNGLPQRIRGGMVHWLFRKEVWDELFG